jgi:hypothetical protein
MAAAPPADEVTRQRLREIPLAESVTLIASRSRKAIAGRWSRRPPQVVEAALGGFAC